MKNNFIFKYDTVEALRFSQDVTRETIDEFFKDYPEDTYRTINWLGNPKLLSVAIKVSEGDYRPLNYGEVLVRTKSNNKTFEDFIVMSKKSFDQLFIIDEV